MVEETEDDFFGTVGTAVAVVVVGVAFFGGALALEFLAATEAEAEAALVGVFDLEAAVAPAFCVAAVDGFFAAAVATGFFLACIFELPPV